MDKYQEFKKKSANWKLLVAADVVVFSFNENKLKILLIKRKYDPGAGKWAIPGGFVRDDESLSQAALRELAEETGIKKKMYLEQLYTFGEIDRDPRGRVISVTYLALLPEADKIKLSATEDAKTAQWFEIEKLPPLAFRKAHQEIIDYARQRLKWKLEYTNVAFSLLPKEFTLTQLQKLYEAVYREKLDKRNFRKKILSLDLVEALDKYEQERGRPAQLYSAKKNNLEIYLKII